MKKNIFIFLFLYSFQTYSQPTLNERYDFSPNSIYSNVIATDSCYYVTGMRALSPGFSNQEGAFIKFNLDGTIADSTFYANDTIGYIFWESSNLIQTLDGFFAQTFTVTPENSDYHFGFIKFKPNGDTLIFNTYLDLFNENNDDWVLQPGGFFQDPIDSTYFGTVNVGRYSDLVGGVALFKLSKTGDLLWHETFYGVSGNFRIYKGNSLLKIAPNRIMIGGTQLHFTAATSGTRYNTKLIVTDTLGNLIQTKIFPQDLLANNCNGLLQTIDGGFVYAGQNGFFVQNGNAIRNKGRIVKLNSNLNEEWRIELGLPTSESLMNFENILKITDSAFVAVGRTIDTVSNEVSNSAGWLAKFDLDGEINWRRYYQKVLADDNTINFPKHILYDVAITSDSGFVMVGQSVNQESTNPEPIGQLGWLVKTDKHGCLVPGCEQYDNVSITETELPKIGLSLFPNPASNELFVYFANNNHTTTARANLFNIQGQKVTEWPLNTNYTTYMLDVSNYANGVYVLQVVDNNKVLKTERLVIR